MTVGDTDVDEGDGTNGGAMGVQTGGGGWADTDSSGGESALRSMGYTVDGDPAPDEEATDESVLRSPIVTEVAVFLARALGVALAVFYYLWG